ncbi:hypothetical protein V6V47_13950 [Micromonospora sp. CPCC 205539]
MTTPPPLAGRRVPGAPVVLPLRLAEARWRIFPPADDELGPALYDQIDRYLGDLVVNYGRAYRPEVLRDARPVSFAAMAAQIVGDGPSVDLVVLAHAKPDVDPRLSAGCLLTETLPGAPVAFAVSEQGRVAMFTALRVASAYAASEPFARVLVMAFDQRAVPWQVAEREAVPGIDAAVALVFDRVPPGDPGGVLLWQHNGVAPDAVGDRLAADLAELAGRTNPTCPVRVLAGPGVPPDALPPSLDRSDAVSWAGPMATSVWPAAATGAGPLVLVEYDDRFGYLSLCRLDLPDAA